MTEIIEKLSEIAERYDAVFCDLWGCVHDGVRPFGPAVSALQEFRRGGGRVVLLTNAPRPRADVQDQLDYLGVPRDAWDTIATSGDSARLAIFEGAVGTKVWHIGESRDTTFFEPLRMIEDCPEVELVELDEADGIVCTGPFDVHADPDVNRPNFEIAVAKGLKLLCANPDIVVDRGATREWCAGALAALYTQLGGTSLYFGKPHAPVYHLARKRLDEVQSGIPDDRILAIGDGPGTDVAGALAAGLDCIFVTGGLMAEDTKTSYNPDAGALNDYLARERLQPRYAMGFLR